MEMFGHRKVKKEHIKEKYRVEVSNRAAALEDMDPVIKNKYSL
jgi:hypothetical protein